MTKRILTLLEVITLTVILMVLAHWLPALVTKTFGKILGNTTIGILWIVPALVLIVMSGRKWSEYGFDLTHNFSQAVHFGFWALVVKMAFEGPGFMLWGKFGTPGAFILIILVILSIWLLLWLFRKDPEKPRIDWKMAIIIGLLVLPGCIAAVSGKDVGRILLWQTYFLVVVGFGEELLNRGYIQSRLNHAWGRPWKIWGTQFGPGLLWASLIFGVPHIYQIGADQINILMGVGACLGGLFFGLIREKTGSITAGVIAHGVANAAGQIYMYLK